MELGSLIARGSALQPLPASGDEVNTITGLYPDSGRKFLGEAAREEEAREMSGNARYLHFACHGVLNDQFPLNSALALTIPAEPKEGQQNGLLQAWEIFEGVRTNADLVTMSGCETAVGKEAGPEGLISLTRAFQYAGARSVLAFALGCVR